MKRNLLFLLVLTLFASNAFSAQDSSRLLNQISQDLKDKEPSWRVERIYDSPTREPITKAIVLRAGKGQAAIHINIWKQVKDAKEDFVLSTADITWTRKGVKTPLAGFGEESFMWKNKGSNAWPIINFRQGRVYVSVFAPSVKTAKRFAEHILGSIRASQ